MTALVLPHTTLWFVGSLLLLTAYWLYRVGQAARSRHVPYAAWWAVPGLLIMLFAQDPQQPQPALFALGAAALLLAEFWPKAYRPASRPAATWPVLGLLLGLVLVAAAQSAANMQQLEQPVALAAGLGLTLCGLAGLLLYALWSKAAPRTTRLGFEMRWNTVTIPEWPDFSVTLTTRGAELRNVSRQTLALAGWSPVSINSWLTLRDEQGQPLNELGAGQTTFLPLSSSERGVRVWYALSGKEYDPRLFRADWVPARSRGSRVLN